MKSSQIALNSYFLLCVLSTIANFLGNDTLLLLTKPLIIPVLFFYYYFKVSKVNLLLSLLLFFSFLGDSIGLLNFDSEIQYILYPFFVCNLIIIFICIRHLEKFKFNIFNIFSIILMFIFLAYLWLSVVDLFEYYDSSLRNKVEIYGTSLFLVVFLASYNLICKVSTANLNMLIFSTCIIISDIFYISYNFQNQLILLNSIHFIAQIFSYYFVVKFFLNKRSQSLF